LFGLTGLFCGYRVWGGIYYVFILLTPIFDHSFSDEWNICCIPFPLSAVLLPPPEGVSSNMEV